jgi:hypothetical protein
MKHSMGTTVMLEEGGVFWCRLNCEGAESDALYGDVGMHMVRVCGGANTDGNYGEGVWVTVRVLVAAAACRARALAGGAVSRTKSVCGWNDEMKGSDDLQVLLLNDVAWKPRSTRSSSKRCRRVTHEIRRRTTASVLRSSMQRTGCPADGRRNHPARISHAACDGIRARSGSHRSRWPPAA